MISHRHKCIFIHIPKTAGMSINSFFHPGVRFHHSIPDYTRLFGWCSKRRLHMQHATSKQLLETELITEDQWKDYYKFTFVRNPWDRAYSDYKWVQDFSGIKGSFKNYILGNGEFQNIMGNSLNDNYLGDHLLPQTEFFDLSGNFAIDFVGRFENFEKDISAILKKLHINDQFAIHINKSKRNPNYANFYSRTNQKLVESIYKEDIQLLQYYFQKKRTGINILKKLF